MTPFARDFVTDVISQPVGGLNESLSLDGLAKEEATTAQNVNPWKRTIAKRYGSVKIGDQIAPSAWSNERVCYWLYQFRKRDGTSELLAVFGTHLYKLDTGSNTWRGAISGTNPAGAGDVFGGGKNLGSAIQYNDIIYYCDGDVTQRYNGTAIVDWSWAGGTLAAATLSAGTAGGSLSAGAYTMVYTYYDPATGEETNPSAVSSPPITVTVNQKIPFSIPADVDWQVRFTKVRIYRTRADGAGAWFFEVEVNAGTLSTTPITSAGISVWLSVSDSSLGSQVATDNDPVPKLRYVVMHHERVLGAGIATSPSQLVWSKSGSPFWWPALNGQYLSRDDGHPIRALFSPMWGPAFAWKRGGPGFEIAEHSTLTYSPLQLPAKHGCESHHSVIVTSNEIFFVDKTGIVRFNGQQTELQSRYVQSTFKTLASTVDGSVTLTGDAALVERCFGIHDNSPDAPHFRFFFAHADTSGLRDSQLVMDDISGSTPWHVETYRASRGLRVAAQIEDSSRQVAVYCGDGDGHVYRLRSTTAGADVYSDDGDAINFIWRSPWISYGEGFADFMPRWVDFEIEKSASGKTTGALNLYVWKDGDASTVIVTKAVALVDTGALKFVVRMDIPVAAASAYYKRIRIGMDHNAANGDVSVIKYSVTYVPIGIRLKGIA